MSISEIILWPGTKVCERFGVDPTADAGLIRSMVNMLVYSTVFLTITWIIMT